MDLEQQQEGSHTPKRAKTTADGAEEEEEGDAEAMAVDAVDLRAEVQAFLAQAKAADPALPDPPDLPAFIENPFVYNPTADVLHPKTGAVDADGNTALMVAIKAGADKAVFVLLAGKDQAYVNKQNAKGVTALNVASHRGFLEPVRELLEGAVKADVNIPNTSGSTSLIQASHFGHTEVVHLLLKHGATVDLPNLKGTTALMRAAQEGHVAVVAALLGRAADVNKRNHERMNALMLASQRGHDAIVQMLIKHGADIDCQTVQGSTALMLACKRQHEAVVRVLLTAGAEMFVKDSRGRTARDTALKRNHKPIIAMLQASRQVRLMQTEARVQRAHLLAKLYELHSHDRAFPILPEDPMADAADADADDDVLPRGPAANHHSQAMLARAMTLPFPLFQHIARYLPWPRMWGPLLPILHKRCHVDANEALRGALTIMNEVLTDLNVSTDPVQEMHLVRAARSPALGELLRITHRMPGDMVDTLVKWNDAQSILARFERGVTFSPLVADRAVKDAARLYHWHSLGGEDPSDSDGMVREDEGTGVEMGQDEEDDDEGEDGGGGGGHGGGPVVQALPPQPQQHVPPVPPAAPMVVVNAGAGPAAGGVFMQVAGGGGGGGGGGGDAAETGSDTEG